MIIILGTVVENVSSIFIQIAIGLTFGIGWGLLLRYIPASDQKFGYVIGGRLALLLFGGFIAIFGGHALKYSGAGPLGCLISGFIANVSWRQQSGWGKKGRPVMNQTKIITNSIMISSMFKTYNCRILWLKYWPDCGFSLNPCFSA